MGRKKPNRESPCINVCILGEDDICTGCFRALDEIADWGGASVKQQQRIVTNANHRKEKANGD